MVVDVSRNCSCVKDQSGHHVTVPRGTIGSERSINREGAEAPGVLKANIEWRWDGIERRGWCSEVWSGVDKCGLEESGGASKEEATVIRLKIPVLDTIFVWGNILISNLPH